MPRQVYEQAIIWASKATVSSNFWKKQRGTSKSDSLKIPSESYNLQTETYAYLFIVMTEKEGVLENSQE